MKMFVLKNKEGKYLLASKYKADEIVERPWEAKLFRRKCDATNSITSGRKDFQVVQVEVRVKEDA